MEIADLQTLLNILRECNVSYYQDSEVTLRFGGGHSVAADASSVEPETQKTKEQEKFEEQLSRLPDQYQLLRR